MNENIKKMILNLAELAVAHERFRLNITGSTLIVMVSPKEADKDLDWDWCYYDCIYIPDEDTESRLNTALKFINAIGGKENE